MFDENLHNLIKKRNKNTSVIIGAAAVLTAVIRIFLTRFYIDPEVHFYSADSNMFVLSFDYAAAAGIAAVYIISIFFYKYKINSQNYAAVSGSFVQGTQTQVFSASICGFLLAASAVFQVIELFGGSQSRPFAEVLSAYMKENIFDFILFFASILCAVYFFKTAALAFNAGENKKSAGDSENTEEQEEKYEFSQVHIILSFMPILWSFLNIFKCFFDMSKSVNSPVRIYELMCFLALSAYFVAESRMLVGRRGIGRFFTFAYIALILTALSALPNLILSSFWIMQTNNTQILYAVELSFVLYIASRIYSQIKYGRFMLEQ
jgi:hypothetical protein